MVSDDQNEEKEPEDNKDDKKRSAEEVFLKGYTSEDDEDLEFDEELLELTRERSRGSVLRPILMLLVIVFVGSVINDWRDELTYFFSSSDPIEMGDVADFPVFAAQDPDWEPPVQHNRYVSLEGMPTRISRGGEQEFFRLIGGEFYVQRKLDEEAIARAEQKLPSRQDLMGLGGMAEGDRFRYQGEGRLMSFAAAPERFRGLKAHYGERYGTRFCEDYSDRQRQELERQRLEVVRSNWSVRYQNATEEERQRRSLTPEPKEEELEDLLQRNPVCVHAYLIHDGQRPVDVWWHVLFSALLAALMVFNAVKLVKWFRDWFRVN